MGLCRRRAVAAALVLLLASGVAGAAVVTPAERTSGLTQSAAATQNPGELIPVGIVAGKTTDGNVTNVTVLVENEGLLSQMDVRVRLVRKDGTVVAEAVKTDVVLSNGYNEVLVEFTGTWDPADYSRISSTVARTL